MWREFFPVARALDDDLAELEAKINRIFRGKDDVSANTNRLGGATDGDEAAGLHEGERTDSAVA